MADDEGHVITTASSRGRTLDVEERQKRYLITMTVRTLCFFAFLIVPGWWKIAALAGAAIIPVFAVVLANSVDHRPTPVASEPDEVERLALPAGEVIPGDVVSE